MGERDYWRPGYGAPPRTPFWSTYPGTKAILIALVAIHVVMAFLQRAAPGGASTIYDLFLLRPEYALKRFYVWQLLTCALFHEPGLWHLFGNLIMIFFFGRMVEQRVGTKRFLYFVLAAQLTASLGFLLEAAILDKSMYMLGASGFAMGLTILAALWYPQMTVLVFFVLPLPLWVLAAFLILANLLYLLDGPAGVANSAHLGGALYGFVYWKYGGGMERVFGAIDQIADQRRHKREQKSRRREAELRREIDRILDKVNREGMAALSKEERRFLKEASDKLRR